jgi:hypothetical protein
VSVFYDSWVWIENDYSSPFEIIWDNASLGTHQLIMRGEDASGNRTPKQIINIEVVTSKSATISEIDEEVINQTIKVYPNPVKDEKLLIDVSGFEYNCTILISLSNLNGQIVHKESFKSWQNNLNISMSDYKAGIYLLTIQTDNFIKNMKVVVE